MKACIGEFYEDNDENCTDCPDRAYCQSFAEYITRTSHKISEFIDVQYDGHRFHVVYKDGFNEDKLREICNEQIKWKNNESRRKKITEINKQRDRIGDEGRKKAGAHTKKYWKKRTDDLVDDYKHFRRHLAKQFDRDMVFAKKNTAPIRGQFVDFFKWRKVEKLISVYYKNERYQEVLVCVLSLRVRGNVTDVEINAELPEVEKRLSLMDTRKLRPMVDTEVVKAKRTSCRALDREKLAIAAETIAQLVKDGYFDTKVRA